MSGREQRIQIEDRRSLPVSVVLHDDLALIAATFEGRRLPVARSVYLAVLQLVAEANGAYGEATRKELAALAGVSVRTLDEFTQALEDGMLMHRVQRREDGLNLPNLYGLGPAGRVVQGTALPPSDSAQHTSSPSRSKKTEDGGGLPALPLPDGIELSDDIRADALELLGRRARPKVNSATVTPEEMAKAAAAISAFNRSGGTDFGLGAHLTPLVMRIRERPSWDAGKFVRLVESAWRLKWWERRGKGGRATPAVVFGNPQVFEQVAQDAADEAAGKPLDTSAPTAAKRFTRSD